MAENSPKILKESEEITKEPKRKRRMSEEIKMIENQDELHTTFTKRRQGLFKKAAELCHTCGAQAAVITFSSSGDACVQGYPEFDPVLNRYLAYASSSVAADVILAAMLKGSEERINEALGKGRPAWDAVTVTLGWNELDQMETAMKYVKSRVKMCKEKTCVQN